MEKQYKTPIYTREASKRYSEKIVVKKFTAKSDTDRGKWLEVAKSDKDFNEKFWEWMKNEYSE